VLLDLYTTMTECVIIRSKYRRHTILNEHFLIVHDSDVSCRQVLDLAVFDLPQLLSNLRNKTCNSTILSFCSCHDQITYGNRETQ
jgi:hypothetical protein